MPEPNSRRTKLTAAAAQLYLTTTHVSLARGILSWDQYLLRLRFVRDCAELETIESLAAAGILQEHAFGGEDGWLDGEPDGPPNESASGSELKMSDRHAPFEPPVLQFMAGAATGLQRWRFHQTDADFFPSIPHGHWDSDDRKKLDAYRGWVYQDDKQSGREPRWKIIALWNDDKFRSFATVAIQYYLAAFPGYLWPLLNPRRLPRRR